MTEQPLPARGQVDVTEALIAHLRERQAKGIEKYGRPLETFNGRDMLLDAFQESLDQSQYLLGKILEGDELVRLLRELVAPKDAGVRKVGPMYECVHCGARHWHSQGVEHGEQCPVRQARALLPGDAGRGEGG